MSSKEKINFDKSSLYNSIFSNFQSIFDIIKHFLFLDLIIKSIYVENAKEEIPECFPRTQTIDEWTLLIIKIENFLFPICNSSSEGEKM